VIFSRLFKNATMQVELFEIPLAGAPLPPPKRLPAGRRNPSVGAIHELPLHGCTPQQLALLDRKQTVFCF